MEILEQKNKISEILKIYQMGSNIDQTPKKKMSMDLMTN